MSVVVIQGARHRAIPTPSATPPLRGEDEIEDEQAIHDHLAEPESSHGRATESPPRRAANVESEDEEVFVGSRYGDDEADRSARANDFDDDEEEQEEEDELEEEDAPHARQVLNKEYPSERRQAKRKIVHDSDEDEEEEAPHTRQVLSKELSAGKKQAKGRVVKEEDEDAPSARLVKQEPVEEKTQGKVKAAPKVRAESSKAPAANGPPKSRGPANRSVGTPESSRVVSDPEERFKVHVTGPKPDNKAEFMTRGGHLVRKVLAGVCKNFDLDIDHAKLLLCMPILNDDGEVEMAQFECDKNETMARSGVQPNSKLVVRVV
ncbi:hypothetical protein C8R45DRAFT_1092753 [Mycena sanguinolenta]|nr:hypothetical protein C8R45DRAFT_1092753 [Mycena sanguinolenta]